MDSYEDIIHLPRHVSMKRPHMSLINRAAQFAPFAALTGFDYLITDTARKAEKEVLDSEWYDEYLVYDPP